MWQEVFEWVEIGKRNRLVISCSTSDVLVGKKVENKWTDWEGEKSGGADGKSLVDDTSFM